MSVIEKVLKLMEQNHISAKKLTTDLGLANSSISEWKKGKARPSLEAVIKIAGYFGVTTDFLLLDQEADLCGRFSDPDGAAVRQDSGEEAGRIVFNTVLQAQREQDSERRGEAEVIPPAGSASRSGRRSYREHLSIPEERYDSKERYALEQLPEEMRSLLECYYRLDEKDREYIRSKMIVLERESMD